MSPVMVQALVDVSAAVDQGPFAKKNTRGYVAAAGCVQAQPVR